MKRLDRLIMMELVGPWLFGVAMFTTLIVASTILPKVSEYVVGGVPVMTVFELFALFLPAGVVKTFPMAMLLAGLLGFGRLSSDSEVTALKASGVSILRMMRPVAFLALAVAGLSFAVNETLVPASSYRFLEIKGSIQKNLDLKSTQSVSFPISRNGNLAGLVTARDFDLKARTLTGVSIVTFDKEGQPSSWFYVKQLLFNEDDFKAGRGGWNIVGGGKLIPADGSYVLKIDNEAWPSGIPRPDTSPSDLITASTSDQFDSFSMNQMRKYIDAQRQIKTVPRSKIWNWESAYWDKIALPLAALVFGLLGAPLGIRNQRAGTATGFALSVTIIFAYIQMSSLLKVSAQGGFIPPYVASFTPLAIGLLCSGVIMWRRNN